MILIKVKKRARKLFTNTIVKWVIIPCALLLLWFCLSLLYSSYKSFAVLQYAHNQDKNSNFHSKRLLKGQKLMGKFRAVENNLGIVSVKFGRIPRVNFNNEDVIVFRLKEKDQKTWLYENRYKSGLMRSYHFFPFGFIPLTNSKGRIYEFEITSLNGNISNGIEVGNTNPIYLSKYKFSKTEAIKNRESFERFIFNKIFTLYTDYDTLVFSSLFILPFIFYMVWILIVPNYTFLSLVKTWIKIPKSLSNVTKKILKLRKKLFAFLIVSLMFYYILIFEDVVAGLTLGLLGCWGISVYANKFKCKVTFILSFIFILFSVFVLYFNQVFFVDKASSFAYYLIILGFLQSVIGKRKSYRDKKIKIYRRAN